MPKIAKISDEDRDKLVALAREAVEANVLGQLPPQPCDTTGILTEQRGCFVTLTNHGQLRGCIGTFVPQEPLGKLIVSMGTSAANDPRFTADPITPPELGQIHVEVSILSPLVETDNPEQLEIGKHGIYIVHSGRAGCFLPEVATDYNWGPEEFLSTCCAHKAGMSADAWRDPQATVYLFTSEKFGR